MNSEQWQRVQELLEAALELEPAERDGYLREHCDDDAVRREVEAMLDVHDGPATLRIEKRLVNDSASPHVDDLTGSRAGAYRLDRRIGAGGMGEVYLAERDDDQYRQQVAVKVIRGGLIGQEAIDRFRQERQILASLDHPNIARVIDGGTTEESRPYFVMEYIDGATITHYCDRNRLKTEERLELFLQVCAGIQHAHQKGVIHRDLKPSNVLVAEGGTPKIIDFGVAKTVGSDAPDHSRFTQLGQIIGTPEYMSPEQATFDGPSLDTRTDVYSLGVLLYEMLVGALPFDAESFRSSGFEEICRRIRQDTPTRPSARLSTLGNGLTEAAQNRRTDARSLRKQLSGELDWIVMKALEKDPDQRYASPHELAADLTRHRAGEAVLAGPPSATYRLSKFIRRYRVGVATAGLILVALVAGGAVATWQAVRATRAEAAAQRETRTSQRVADFLVSLFESSSPAEARGADITARELLERGQRQIADGLDDEPRVRVRLLNTMSQVNAALGLYDRSLDLAQQAATIERAESGELSDPATLIRLGTAYGETGDDTEAFRLLEEALRIREEKLGPDDPAVADVLYQIGTFRLRRREYPLARPLLQRALTIREAALGPNDVEVARCLMGLAIANGERIDGGSPDIALPLLKRARTIFEAGLPPDHPTLADVIESIALQESNLGHRDEALALLEQSLEMRRRVLEPDHPFIANSLWNIGRIHVDGGEIDLALPLYEEALRIRQASLGPDHVKTAALMESTGIAWAMKGDLERAREYLEGSLEINETQLGPENRETLETVTNLATLAAFEKDYEDTLRLLRRSADGTYLAPHHLAHAVFDPLREDPEFQALEQKALQNAPSE